MKNTVVFDLDGTLLNTLDDLTEAVNTALRRFGFAERGPAEVRDFLGHGFAYLIDCSLPAGTDEKTKAAVLEFFLPHYLAHCTDRTAPYDGILELLSSLGARGCRLAIVSNKGDRAVHELAARYFPGMVPVVVGERPDVRNKPAPDSVNAALRALGSEAADAVYVGDSEVDAQTAANAGLPCVLVSWGFRDRALLEAQKAVAVIDSPAALPPLLERL